MRIIDFYRYTDNNSEIALSFEPMSTTSAQKSILVIADPNHYLENQITKLKKHSIMIYESQLELWIEKEYH